ncbi:hypothetical protein SAMN05444583_102285 [Rhodococcus maanshanensis]|uniref:Uncharacterized protein n=1 Tax=Rhodococcus maanshanensis TaxID=183556 RepID=A0A1H7I290_9NOCA|nr:hypothetical protein SAMN05444583_102285 [Rhodococcus maanshanensis]
MSGKSVKPFTPLDQEVWRVHDSGTFGVLRKS